jgi:hypothetical protein
MQADRNYPPYNDSHWPNDWKSTASNPRLKDGDGIYLIGAAAGFGIMSACGAGDLLTRHIIGGKIPAHGFAFELSRYDDPHYRRKVEGWKDDGQL